MSEEETTEREDNWNEFKEFSFWLDQVKLKIDAEEIPDASLLNRLAFLCMGLRAELPKDQVLAQMKRDGYWPTFLALDHGFSWIREDKERNAPKHINEIKDNLGKGGVFKSNAPKDLINSFIGIGLEAKNVASLKKNEFWDCRWLELPEDEWDSESLTRLSDDAIEGLKLLADWDQKHPAAPRTEGPLDEPNKLHFFKGMCINQWHELKKVVTKHPKRFLKKDTQENYIVIEEIPWTSSLHKQSPFMHSDVYWKSWT